MAYVNSFAEHSKLSRTPEAILNEKRDSRTDERRQRVLQMFGKKRSLIAKVLLEEGFEIDSGEQPVTKALLEAWQARRLASMCRNVDNDFEFWDKEWRKRSKIPRSGEDNASELEGYIASLRSDLDDIDDLIVDEKTKPTAKAILLGEKRQTRALIAKARGVDQAVERAAEPDAKIPVLGLIIGTKNVSDEMRERLEKHGVKF